MPQTILIIEDDKTFNHLITDHLKRAGYQLGNASTWEQASLYLESSEPDLVIMDVRLPDANGLQILPEIAQAYPIVMLTAYGSVHEAVRAVKAGAMDYLTKPISLDELEVVVSRTLENAAVRKDLNFHRAMIQGEHEMVGTSQAMQQIGKQIQVVATSDITVLILGESGTGKELVSKAIHRSSPRANRNFVTVDCCTLSEQLFESELFGYEKGSFTGADRQKKGLIEGASGGTLFLDEIGDITLHAQAKLLRVLETGKFRRVGGTKDLNADVRIVTATNRNLTQMNQKKEFREDLYYRLNAFSFQLPPLRDRASDIPQLAKHFIKNNGLSKNVNISINDQALNSLMAYHWPGNIRELKNMIERAMILMGEESVITPEHLIFNTPENMTTSPSAFMLRFNYQPTLEQIEKKYLLQALEKNQGHRSKTARMLGISERTLYRLMKKYKYNKSSLAV